tara:strand:+ start:104 stop:247 length:144 start_codon:yes stop_codon:yes gene_type:complete
VSARAVVLLKDLIGSVLIAGGTPEDRLLTLIENCELDHGFTKRLIKG